MSIVPAGYPDWSRRGARSDEMLFDGSLGTGAAATSTGIISVGGSSAIATYFSNSAGSSFLQLDWYLDAAGATYLSTNFIDLGGSATFYGGMPTLGPFVKFTAVSLGGADVADLKSWTLWQPGPHDLSVYGTRLINIPGTTVGPASTWTNTAGNVWPGMAMLAFNTTATLFTIDVFVTDFAGSTYPLAHLDQNMGASFVTPISVPAMPLGVTVTNNDAANKVFHVYATAATYSPIT